MGKEEQQEEREVLESIFPDEITEISETEYRISITLEPPESEESDDPPPVLVLHVRYPDAYPDEAPILDISPPPNAPPHPLFSVAGDKDGLLSSLEESIQENLGMAMVFTLVTSLKEAAEQLIIDRQAAAEKRREEVVLAAEREENKKFHGTPVTPETFLKWREEFLQEMEEARIRAEEEKLAELKKARIKDPTRLTGRQLWERGLAGKVDEVEDDDGVANEVEKLKVTA
jgi:hypothetical protein